MKKEDPGYPIGRGVLLPAATVGGALFMGGLIGGTAGKALSETRGVQQWLSRASPARKAILMNRIRLGAGSLGAAAGAGVGAVSYNALENELKKREQAKSSEKTAMFLACFRNIGFT